MDLGDAGRSSDGAEMLYRIPSRAPWRVTSVECRPNMQLAVRFIDGTEGVCSLKRLLTEELIEGSVFEPLLDPDMFARAYVEYGAVTWPTGVDIAPDAMHELILASGGAVVEV